MYLITGGNGQLGTNYAIYWMETIVAYVSTDSQEMDITDANATMTRSRNQTQGYFFHCAAYTAVDQKAEDEGKMLDEKNQCRGNPKCGSSS